MQIWLSMFCWIQLVGSLASTTSQVALLVEYDFLSIYCPCSGWTAISRSTKQESNKGNHLFKTTTKLFSKRWQNGEICNFQYLMHLKTLVGRGYDNLTQYPVFTWVLTDYEGENLDLSNTRKG